MAPVLRLATAGGALAVAALGLTVGTHHSTSAPTTSFVQAAQTDVAQVATDGQTPAKQRRLTDAQRAELKKTGHLSLTLQTKKNGAVTVLLRGGHVTAVSPTSITVKSKDGSSATYAVRDVTKVKARTRGAKATDSSLSAVKVGSRVGVLAVERKDGTVVARRIRLLPAAAAKGSKAPATGTASAT